MSNAFQGFSCLPDNGASPDAIVWLMHGCGGTGEDFAKTILPDLKSVFTNAAIYAPDGMLPSRDGGYQHFEIEEHYTRDLFTKSPAEWLKHESARMNAIRVGADKNASLTNDQIDMLLTHHGLSDSDVIMIGYSQGAQSVLHAAFRRERPVGAVVCVFGSLIDPENHAEDLRSQPPVILVGSDSDAVLPPQSTILASTVIAAAKGDVRMEMVADADHHKDWASALAQTALPAYANQKAFQ